jgi:hypothetical protein
MKLHRIDVQERRTSGRLRAEKVCLGVKTPDGAQRQVRLTHTAGCSSDWAPCFRVPARDQAGHGREADDAVVGSIGIRLVVGDRHGV